LYRLTEEIKGGGREWVKSKNCKAKEEDIVYTIGKTSKKGSIALDPQCLLLSHQFLLQLPHL
jgi:hypothetical protein